jgi:hypothetical protein
VIIPASARAFIALQRTGRVVEDYGEVIAAEWAEIAPYLPAEVEAVLDIGCGVAGIDVHLHRRYPDATIYLLDRTERAARIPYGYGDPSFYNSLAAAGELLEENGVPGDRVRTIQAPGNDPLPEVGLVASLLAWGFHFPVMEYRDRLRLAPGAVAVLDLRCGTDGAAAMTERFELVATLRADDKRERTAWRLRE